MPGGQSTTVLVVDDEPAIRLLCRVNLELDGYVVLEAGSVADARAQLDETHVDVVLLDLHLGGELSTVLIEELAARTPRVPVGLVTGSVGIESAQETGADVVLSKPFTIDELAAAVQSLAAAAAGTRG